MMTTLLFLMAFNNSNFNYQRKVDTLGPGFTPNYCSGQAFFHANGTLRYLEGFSGNIAGDLGRVSLRSVTREIVSNPFGTLAYSDTKTTTRDVPEDANVNVTFSHQHAPYDLPVVRVVVRKVISCNNSASDTDTEGCNAIPDQEGGTNPDDDPIRIDDSPTCDSPLILDLDADGFQFGGIDHPVLFDLRGNSVPSLLSWVQPNSGDGFLVNDLDQDGIVVNGTELFGNGTRMILEEGRSAANGYEALGQWDDPQLGGNNDGFISSDDKIWSSLRIWLDHNADGICEPHEMTEPAQFDIIRFDLAPTRVRFYDNNGNLLLYWSQALMSDSGQLTMVDVFFQKLLDK